MNDLEESAASLRVNVAPCSTAHDAETVSQFDLPGGAWPGMASVTREATTRCLKEVSSAAGGAPRLEKIKAFYLHPTEQSWQSQNDARCCALPSSRSRGGGRSSLTSVESVWDYPRPPALEASTKRVRVEHNGETVADSERALRVLETSQPPAYYIPPEDVRLDLLTPHERRTMCEWKGRAQYWTVIGSQAAAWSYAQPDERYAALRDHVAFYPQKVDACFVGEERVEPNAGDFYGGWVTSDITGPFKGGPGTAGW